MASLKTCGNLLLLSCGEKVAIFDVRCPKDASILSLPGVEAKDKQSKRKQKAENVAQDGKEDTPKSPAGSKSPPPNRVLATAISGDGHYIAVCDDQKYLHVFHDKDRDAQRLGDGNGGVHWKLESSRLVSRRCTGVLFTSDLQTILVADKSGDVFSFPTSPPASSTASASPASATATTTTPTTPTTPAPESTTPAKDNVQIDAETGENVVDVAMEMDDDGDDDGGGGCGKLVLGHLSMVLDIILIDEDRLVVTSDRDEKIRISHYPDSYNIHTYCLGHTAFVKSLVCDDKKKVLFSGSGDVNVGLWNYGGDVIHMRNCLQDFPELKCSDTKQENKTSKEEDEVEDMKEESELRAEEGEDPKHAVQQIVYCPDTNLLFVSLYQCPHIPVYRLVSQSSSNDQGNQYTLQPVKTLTTTTTTTNTTTTGTPLDHGSVVSLCVQGSTLWIVRECQWPQMRLEAVKFRVQGEEVLTVDVDVSGEGDECQMMQTISSHTHSLLQAPPTWQDPIPHLWKSQIDGYVQEYLERKRQRVEGEVVVQGERWGKKKRGKKGGKNGGQDHGL